MIQFECHNCSKQLNARNDWAGRRVRCGKCKATIQIPTPSSAPPPIPEYAEAPPESSPFKEAFSEFRQEAVKAASQQGAKVTEKALSFLKNENQEEKGGAGTLNRQKAAPTGFRDFLTTFYLLPRNKKFALTACTLLLLIATGLSPSCSSLSPSLGVFGKRDGSLNLTIGEFRKEIVHRSHLKSEFYEKYGPPQNVTTIGDSTYLIYSCTDGRCRVEAQRATFQGYNGPAKVHAFGVDET